MANLNHVSCCGVKEIANLQDAKNSLEALKVILNGFNFSNRKGAPKRMGQLFFTQADNVGEKARPNYGYHFADFIRNQKLGDIVEAAKKAPNPNYQKGHLIKIWIWTPDPKKCWKWWLKNGGTKRESLNAWW